MTVQNGDVLVVMLETADARKAAFGDVGEPGAGNFRLLIIDESR